MQCKLDQSPGVRGKRSLCVGAVGAFLIAATLGALLIVRGQREAAPHELESVQGELRAAKTRTDALRAQLTQESLNVLVGAVVARDPAAVENARNGVVALGISCVPACRELAIKTASDPLKRELIAVIGAFKEPEAAAALVDIYQSQSGGHREVKEVAARTLTKMGTRAAAMGLGRLVREERNPSYKELLVQFYAPVAHTDPMGTAKDPEVRKEISKGLENAALYRDIQRMDAAKDEDYSRLRELARSDEAAALRLAALQKVASRKDGKAADLLFEVARNPGKDAEGLIRSNALAHLYRSSDAGAITALSGALEGQDTSLRLTALQVAQGSATAEHLLILARIRDGKYPEDHKRLAAQVTERLTAQAQRSVRAEQKDK
jgi:hypothetical protein